MPIVINGSGSITGISVGGLPDGCVQIADLATTGTASGSTFLRGDAAFAEAGGGKILQVVQNENNTQIATSGSTGADFLVGTITPAATSSKILIYCNVTVTVGSTNNAICIWELYRGDSSSGTIINTNWIGKDDSGGFYGGCWMTYLDSPNTTSATTYTLKASRGSQYTGNITASTSYKKSITMVEVAA